MSEVNEEVLVRKFKDSCHKLLRTQLGADSYTGILLVRDDCIVSIKGDQIDLMVMLYTAIQEVARELETSPETVLGYLSHRSLNTHIQGDARMKTTHKVVTKNNGNSRQIEIYRDGQLAGRTGWVHSKGIWGQDPTAEERLSDAVARKLRKLDATNG